MDQMNTNDQLLVAQAKLLSENDEKEQRAAELQIANKELAFQNAEKEKRAEELVIANHELAFQNEEKQKRADELDLANKELVLQNIKKETQAEELIAAIAELKASKEQLVEVNKELESFSYSVSHDLRAPLRAVNGYAKMLQANFSEVLNQEANRLINNIVNNAVKMGRLIDDLLTFSRIGRHELVKVNIPMGELVAGVCKNIEQERGNQIIQLKINQILPAIGDTMAIKQVWLNLLSNAVKYSSVKNPSIIEISSREEDDKIIYTIKDNGAGFDMRYVNKLFGVFQRLHSEEEFEGTGVGLALVHRIITKHGGSVWGEGKVNEGAEFSFTLNKPIEICQIK
jgi:light-regulated signal transduction histidine kinase (bacteriophytochrome)